MVTSVFAPLSITVELDDDAVLLSAFCPKCGRRRRPPDHSAEMWVNPCGHVDTAARCLVEASLQCARPGCVVMVSDRYEPYCTDQCAALDFLELFRSARGQVAGDRVKCARPGCVLLLSEAAFPYCSFACRRLDWMVLFAARAASV